MIGEINRKISDIAVLTNVLPQAQPPNHQALEPDRDPHPIVIIYLLNDVFEILMVLCPLKAVILNNYN